jgi:haloalkane dehalogenase
MVPFERYLVDTGAWRLHVMEHGKGLPVVMVHGNPTWGFLWRKVALELGDSVRSIMPDLMGLGLSDKPQSHCAHTLEAHAAALSTLLQRLDLERFVLVVQDWGGPIGALAARDHADRLAGLVILNTVLGPPRAGFKPTAFHKFAATPVVSDVAFRVLGFPQTRLAGAQGDPSSIQGDVARAYRWPLRSFRDHKAPLALARLVPSSFEHPSIPALRQVEEFVGSLKVPVAIVWGDRDPILGRVIGHMERTFPHARVWRTQAGHFLQEEVPDVIAEAIRWTVEQGGAA